ncbi:MAG: hypothetical protein EBW87_04190 [Burkholderiaceae bacterium]|nr:hypothetical protein [Burkholderiaceae bacterium]
MGVALSNEVTDTHKRNMNPTYDVILERLNQLGFPTYPGCRLSAFDFATNSMGIPVDEILGKINDEVILRAIYDSLRVCGLLQTDEDELTEPATL